MRARAHAYVDACGEYKTPYERERLIQNWEKKQQTAEAVVEDFRKRAMDPEGKRILEVGFGNGAYLVAFSQAGAEVHGLEINETLLSLANELIKEEGVSASTQLYDGRVFPFEKETFDAVYAISVLEHVDNRSLCMAEIARVLKKGGCAYIAFPNRWWPRETHSGYWGISYLPIPLARFVLSLGGLQTIDDLNVHFIDYWTVKKLARAHGLSVRLEVEHGSPLRRLVKRTLAMFGIHHSALLAHVMVVLDKP